MNIGEFVIRFDHILNLCKKSSQFYYVFQPVQTSFLSQLKRTLVCIISATAFLERPGTTDVVRRPAHSSAAYVWQPYLILVDRHV